MDGFINLNKESGLSSQQAVSAVKRLLRVKAGHAGTLDPLATGVLPVCLGRATRLAEYVADGSKVYRARVVFGKETDSYDAAGATLAEVDASSITREQVEALLPRFCGEIMQTPPVISALKQGGEPLYKKARRGETVEVAARPVTIHSIEAGEGSFGNPQPWLELTIACGKGTYIRSLAHDLGALLGVGAHLGALCRTRVGLFTLAQSYTLAQLEQLLAADDTSFLIPPIAGLSLSASVTVGEQASLRRLAHGNDLPLPLGQSADPGEPVKVETADGRLLGIGHFAKEGGESHLKMDKVLLNPEEVEPATPTVGWQHIAAIGNFDGLHLGHQALLARMAELRETTGAISSVITFDPHPLVLIQGRVPALLNTAAEKQDLICNCFGADRLLPIPFTEALMRSGPEEFVERVLVEQVQASQLVVGFNFSFGAGGVGSPQLLRELAGRHGIAVEVMEAVEGDYGVVSSSNIRRHLQDGDLTAVNQMLGYWYSMSGTVMQGNQLGRSLGFPTANFLPPEGKALPPCGVYAARILHGAELFDGVLNFGFRPTIQGGEAQPLVEAHLFDVERPLYGEEITVYFGHFLRGEQQFRGLDELSAQIAKDSRAARDYLAEIPASAHLPKCAGCDKLG